MILGGGVAGLTLASRLAEQASVAVVEAGGLYQVTNGNFSVLPGAAISNAFLTTDPSGPAQPLVDWRFITEPMPHAANRSIHYARGKALGGSAAINGMAYHRASTGTYQAWADLVGDQSYAFDKLLPAFNRGVNFTAPNTALRLPNASVQYDRGAFSNSSAGTLQVGYPNWVDPPLTWLARGMAAIGLPQRGIGFNSGVLNGQSDYVTLTVDNPGGATRSTSQTAYFSQENFSSNQTVYPDTLAKRVLFGANKTATGVLVASGGMDYALMARKEVILAGGVFNSPQLLMLSGVGPKAELAAHNISLVKDLPGVGQNLQDQISFSILQGVNVPTAAQLTAPPYAAAAAQQYHANASGPLSSVDGFVGFEKLPASSRAALSPRTLSELAKYPADWPEVEYLNAVTLYQNNSNIFGVSAAQAAPLSRGNVSLRSADATSPPRIQLGWFSDPGDREVAVAAFKRVRQIWSGMAGVTVGPEVSPGANVTSDEDIFSYIAQSAVTEYHASGTCAMGRANDTNAVVDSQGRVFGVNALRVVDASAFPFAVPGHNQASVYMLAQKIADYMVGNGR